MENEIRILVGDGKAIHARFREVPGAPVVVIAHGMTGHMDGRLEAGIARRLEREGYSSLRFNAYDWGDDTRNLCEMGLREHLDDLGTVIDWASPQTSSVIALGHSYGAMCVVLRGSNGLAAGILWDPASQKVWAEMNRNAATFDAERGQYVQRERVGVIYSERMLHEVEEADAVAAAGSFEAPLLVISAPEWPHMNEAGREYAAQAPRSQRVEIAGADHNFSDDASESTLFDTTITWLQRTVPVGRADQ
jgi:dienelactone hydrolase